MSCYTLRWTLANLDDEAAAVAVELKGEKINAIRATPPKMRERTGKIVTAQTRDDYILKCLLHLGLRFGHCKTLFEFDSDYVPTGPRIEA